ncbi:MAG TPA: CPBP family intramembrane glutamic endopeptidase [Gemmatimonadaceae bacterium]|nr:CPBP family intramembrane glutamic endopeptidase [Gemmatimonadaceae bacterium]
MEETHAAGERPLRHATLGEIALVLGVPTVLFLASSIRWRLSHQGAVVFTDKRLLMTLGLEALLTAVLLPYLLRRGWNPFKIAPPPETADIMRGLLLWLALLVALYSTVLVLYMFVPDIVTFLRTRQFTGAISPSVVVAASLLNPIFEEFLWLGYAVPAVASRAGIGFAAAVSVILRVAVHLYQGKLALISILPIAIVLTWYFVRTGRLWPTVVAHVIVDALGLSRLAV